MKERRLISTLLCLVVLLLCHFEEHEEYVEGALESEIFVLGSEVLRVKKKVASHNLIEGEIAVAD